jgi:Reverse transcriptase (RNA-dependent DNA polymerase)
MGPLACVWQAGLHEGAAREHDDLQLYAAVMQHFMGHVVTSQRAPSDGWSYTIVVRSTDDGVGFNQVTVRNSYLLPLMEELLDRLHGARFFSKLDLQKGCHQFRVAEQNVYKTAFKTRYGLYKFVVLPFGLGHAPATFMHVMNAVFRPHLDTFVIVYLIDVLVYSRTEAEHEAHLRTVQDLLRTHHLRAKASSQKRNYSATR